MFSINWIILGGGFSFNFNSGFIYDWICFGNKTGASCYNLFHHRGIAIALYFAGIYFSNSLIQLQE
ncbi:DUF4260 family protein [Flavobacterium sp. GB2R13]|uniref:DUF4260 family protein n=1 Tax=Flavobacterium algoris TaxID=3398733 RepID=UPI003A84E961